MDSRLFEIARFDVDHGSIEYISMYYDVQDQEIRYEAVKDSGSWPVDIKDFYLMKKEGLE